MSQEFWDNYVKAMRILFQTPVTLPKATQFGKAVWPHFFSNELEKKPNYVRRRNVHIAHADEGAKVSLFIQNRDLESFRQIMRPLLGPTMLIGETTAWATISILVPKLDHGLPVSEQADVLGAVSHAAQELFSFYIANEDAVFSTKPKAARSTSQV